MRTLNEEKKFHEGPIHVPSVYIDLASLISGPTSESPRDFDQVLLGERGPISDP
jgi:hypothetical protein